MSLQTIVCDDPPHSQHWPAPAPSLDNLDRSVMRAQVAPFVARLAERREDRAEIVRELRATTHATPREIAQMLSAAIERGGSRGATAAALAVQLYSVCGEEVAALRVVAGLDSGQAGDVHQHLHLHAPDPETAAALAAAAQYPKVREAMREALEDQARQASQSGPA